LGGDHSGGDLAVDDFNPETGLGPVVLAVAHKPLSAWVDEEIAELGPPGQQEPSQEK